MVDGAQQVYGDMVLPIAGFLDYSMSWMTTDSSVWTDSSAWGGNDKSFRTWNNDATDQTGRGRAFPVRCMKDK